MLLVSTVFCEAPEGPGVMLTSPSLVAADDRHVLLTTRWRDAQLLCTFHPVAQATYRTRGTLDA